MSPGQIERMKPVFECVCRHGEDCGGLIRGQDSRQEDIRVFCVILGGLERRMHHACEAVTKLASLSQPPTAGPPSGSRPDNQTRREVGDLSNLLLR